MLFQPHHITQIRNGTKTVTRRDWAENYSRPTPGAHMATTSMFTPEEECDCWVVIKSVYRQPLGEMEADDFDAEGGYDEDGFKEAWQEINDEPFDPEQVVDVVEFVYGGRSRSEAEAKAAEIGLRDGGEADPEAI